jgi:hypothetical protein
MPVNGVFLDVASDLHGATSQKRAAFIVIAMET